MKSKVTRTILIIAALVFACFVWPTPYQYFNNGSANLRSNRFTGNVQTLSPTGWQDYHPNVEPPTPPAQVDKPLSDTDFARLDADPKTKLSFGADTVNVSIHNSTGENITSVTIKVDITQGSANGTSSKYVLKPDGGKPIPPLTDGTLSATYINPPGPDGYTWEMESATYQ